MAFGDPPFFGGSVWETPPAPQVYNPPAPPVPVPAPQNDYGGQYISNASQSGFQHRGGGFSGYGETPHEGLHHYDHGVRTN